ncbi:MAG: MFS transporter [Bryobacteraceae bacterium]
MPLWLNRNVIGMTITSFCADVGYEMVTAVLPGFLTAIRVPALALGWIEGAADALSSFVKLSAGWYSDRIGHRKGIVAIGYFLSGTALAVFALAVSWPLVLAGRLRGSARASAARCATRCFRNRWPRRCAARCSGFTAPATPWARCSAP